MRLYPFWLAFALTLIIAAEAVLVLHFVGLASAPLQADAATYDQLARNLAYHHVFSESDAPPYQLSHWRPPGFPLVAAGVYFVVGTQIVVVRILQFILLGLASYLLFFVATVAFDRTAGFVAAIVCATYPQFWFLAASYDTEILATLLLIIIALQGMAIARSERHAIRDNVLLGVLLGVLILVRPSFMFFPAAVVLAIDGIDYMRTHRLRIAGTAAAGIACLTTLAPWVIRNSVITGQLTGPAGGGGWSLYVSAQQWSGEVSCKFYRDEWRSVIGEFNHRVEEARRSVPTPPANSRRSKVSQEEAFVDRTYVHDALQKYRTIPASLVAEQLPSRLYWLWSTGDTSPWSTGTPRRVIQTWHVFLTVMAVAGLWLHRRTVEALPLILAPVYLTMIHMVFHVEARYTMVARPFVWTFAAAAVVCLVRGVRSRRISSAVEVVN